MANFDLSVDKTLKFEGGYVNNPNDSGGETNFGISKRFHPNVDIAGLDVDGAKDIYKSEYWNAINGDLIQSQKVADSVFDMAVMSGAKRALSLAKDVCALMGVHDINHVGEWNEAAFVHAYGLARIKFFNDLVLKKPSQKEFINGWISRAKSFFRFAPAGAAVAGVAILATLIFLRTRKKVGQ